MNIKTNADFDIEIRLNDGMQNDFYIVNPIKISKSNDTYTFTFKANTQLSEYIKLRDKEVDYVNLEFKAVCKGMNLLTIIEEYYERFNSYGFSDVYDIKINKIKYDCENEYVNYSRFTPKEKKKFEKEMKATMLKCFFIKFIINVEREGLNEY